MFQFQSREVTCRQAEALRPTANHAFINSYLPADLDPKRMGGLMYHNRINHQCTVVEQCSQLVKLLDSAPYREKNYDKGEFLTQTLESMERLDAIDAALDIKPCKTCFDNWDEVNQLNQQIDILSLVGRKEPEATTGSTQN
uniref:LOB domain-containing protein n=1 Tax=Caenorhabditis tropicalis TaxID=1561998 RepID=A0A1I7T0G1_9PELO